MRLGNFDVILQPRTDPEKAARIAAYESDAGRLGAAAAALVKVGMHQMAADMARMAASAGLWALALRAKA